MLDRDALARRVSEIVQQAMPKQTPVGSLIGDTNLFDAGLTSMAMAKLMLTIEVAFDITIPDADLHPDNFRSMEAIEALVARLQQE